MGGAENGKQRQKEKAVERKTSNGKWREANQARH
jgi:hypothetical protein